MFNTLRQEVACLSDLFYMFRQMKKKKEKSEWYIGPILGFILPLIIGFLVVYYLRWKNL